MGIKSFIITICCFTLFMGIIFFGFIDTIDGAIHDGDVKTYYNTTILTSKQEAYDDNFLIIKIPYYVSTVSVKYSDGTKDSFDVETYRTINAGTKYTIYQYKDKHAVDRQDLFKHRKLKHAGLTLIILSIAVIISIVAPRRRYLNYFS